jgi:hypothetical protein
MILEIVLQLVVNEDGTVHVVWDGDVNLWAMDSLAVRLRLANASSVGGVLKHKKINSVK